MGPDGLPNALYIFYTSLIVTGNKSVYCKSVKGSGSKGCSILKLITFMQKKKNPGSFNFSLMTQFTGIRLVYVQHPERHLFDLSTLRNLPVSRRCGRQAAKYLRPANIPVLLGGAGAYLYTGTPGSSPLSMRLGMVERVVKRGSWVCAR